jgi:hypothetical protein
MTLCPRHGSRCNPLCRFWPEKGGENALVRSRQRWREQIDAIRAPRRRAPINPSAGGCPVHTYRRHPRICRFCRDDSRPDAPPLAPSEDTAFPIME